MGGWVVPSDGLVLMESRETSNFVWNFIQLSSVHFYCVESLLCCDWVMEENKRWKTCNIFGKIRRTQFWRGRELKWKRWWSALNLLMIKFSLLQICWQVIGFHKKAGNFLNSTETDFLEELLEKYIAVKWLSVLLYIQEVMGSDLSPNPGCPKVFVVLLNPSK
jgi:hypothetical protein